jgi:hypothetical protein
MAGCGAISRISLKARVGIGQFTPLLHSKYTRFHWLLKNNHHNHAIPLLTPLVSVSVSAVTGSASVSRNTPPTIFCAVGQLVNEPSCKCEFGHTGRQANFLGTVDFSKLCFQMSSISFAGMSFDFFIDSKLWIIKSPKIA